jgi:hypothetical protein
MSKLQSAGYIVADKAHSATAALRRPTVYRVQCLNGRFEHVFGKKDAVARAKGMVGAPSKTSAKFLQKDWGVTFKRVSPKIAREVGL